MPQSEIDELKRVHVDVLNNMAVCLLRHKQWARVDAVTSDALKYDKSNIKSLMRRAKALTAIGDTQSMLEAERCVDRGLEVDPGLADLIALKKHISQLTATANKLQAERMASMFKKRMNTK